MKVCSNCSTEFEDMLNFCRRDGTALKPKVDGKACPKCGMEVEPDKVFCRHCGVSLEPRRLPEEMRTGKATLSIKEEPVQSVKESGSVLQAAEDFIGIGNYKEAISRLENYLKTNPDDKQARLLHILTSIRLYNIYGYEKQIESIKALQNLTEKERGVAREIFLIRAEEARKRGRQDEAREYQRLAERVILGQPLVETTQQHKEEEAPTQRVEVKPVPRRQVEEPVASPRKRATPTFGRVDTPVRQVSGREQKRGSRLFISFVLVFGLAGVLIAGMLAYYARKQGIEVSDLFGKKPQTKQTEGGSGAVTPSAVAQVIGVEELGFKVWGAGAVDGNRQEAVISEKIESQLTGLRQMYQRVVQEKPDLMGSITLQLAVSPSGTVTKVQEFASRIKDKDFKRAVIDEAYKWRFSEASSGLVKVNYSLLFVPPGMDVASLIKWEQVVGPRGSESAEIERVGRKPSDQTVATTTGSGTAAVQQPPPFLPITKPQPPQPPQVAKERIFIGPYEVLSPTSVYSEPREDSRRVARIDAGTKVNVVDVQGDWLEVRSKHGNPPGFIKKSTAVPWGRR